MEHRLEVADRRGDDTVPVYCGSELDVAVEAIAQIRPTFRRLRHLLGRKSGLLAEWPTIQVAVL